MAELKDKYFGSLSGKFDDVVYRKRGNTNFISKKPKVYTTPTSQLFQERTMKFRLSAKCASIINSIPVLREFWKIKLMPGKSLYTHLISVNYPSTGVNDLQRLKIIPEDGFGVRIDTCNFSADALELNLNPISEVDNININLEKKIQLVAVIFLNNPVSETTDKFSLFKLVSEKTDLVLGTPLTFNIQMSTADADTFLFYQNKKLFFTLVTFDANDIPVYYAKTFCYNI